MRQAIWIYVVLSAMFLVNSCKSDPNAEQRKALQQKRRDLFEATEKLRQATEDVEEMMSEYDALKKTIGPTEAKRIELEVEQDLKREADLACGTPEYEAVRGPRDRFYCRRAGQQVY